MSTLIKWSSNWADEMDVEGFVIVNDEDLRLFKENLEKINDPITISVGTNEWIDFENGDSLEKTLHFRTLTEEQEKVMKELFADSWGCTNFFSQVMEWSC